VQQGSPSLVQVVWTHVGAGVVVVGAAVVVVATQLPAPSQALAPLQPAG
jgi:hypothetical protein